MKEKYYSVRQQMLMTEIAQSILTLKIEINNYDISSY